MKEEEMIPFVAIALNRHLGSQSRLSNYYQELLCWGNSG
jgi:hypothetical protein